MRHIAVVVAGGKGLRMGADLPKQFLLLGDKPILMHTLESFASFDERILVLPEDHIPYWEELKKEHHFTLSHKVVIGGKERFHSVQNALNLIDEDEETYVAIHDGVRPFLSLNLLMKLMQGALLSGAALPVLPMTDSLRQLKGESSVNVPRSEFKRVQTPQVFCLNLIKEAYVQDYTPSFTDDASVYEAKFPHNRIALVEGKERNLKITQEQDLVLAEYYLNHYL